MKAKSLLNQITLNKGNMKVDVCTKGERRAWRFHRSKRLFSKFRGDIINYVRKITPSKRIR